MFNELNQWEIKFDHKDLFDYDMALSEEATIQSDAFFVPPVDRSELEMFDSVTPGFNISLEIFQNESGQIIIEDSIPGYDLHPAVKALMDLSPIDLLDTAKVYEEATIGNSYDLSRVFSYEGIDIDHYDNVSIKMPDSFIYSGELRDWSAIFGEIETYVQGKITEDISDVVISDAQYKARSAITLVKGKKRRNFLSSLEHGFCQISNSHTFNEGRTWAEVQSFNIPMRLYMENGELLFRINLTEIDLRDLERIGHLPHEMNMKSVLSLIPRQSKAK